MTPIDFMAAALAGVLLLGQFLLVLGFMAMALCTLIIVVIIEDICRTLRIKKERRELRKTRSMPVR